MNHSLASGVADSACLAPERSAEPNERSWNGPPKGRVRSSFLLDLGNSVRNAGQNDLSFVVPPLEKVRHRITLIRIVSMWMNTRYPGTELFATEPAQAGERKHELRLSG